MIPEVLEAGSDRLLDASGAHRIGSLLMAGFLWSNRTEGVLLRCLQRLPPLALVVSLGLPGSASPQPAPCPDSTAQSVSPDPQDAGCARDPACRLRLARRARVQGDETGAVGHYEAILQITSAAMEDASSWGARSRALREFGDHQGALELLARWQKAKPTDPEPRVLAGDLFLEKFQVEDARTEYASALEISVDHEPALTGTALVQLERGQFDEAAHQARAAIAADPCAPAPHVVLARIAWIEEDLQAMAEHLDRALAIDGDDEDALCWRGVLLAYQSHRGDPAMVATQVQADFEVLLDKVESGWPRASRFWWRLGEANASRRDAESAKSHLENAVRSDPTFAPALAALGALYMREGDEIKARETLQRAFSIDRYDYRTLNYIRILDYLEKTFITRVSPHIVLRVDAEREPYLPKIFLDRMESAFERITSLYGYTPPGPVIMEVFPRHDMFAGRMSGLPWIGITGGCFGRVIAADSPAIHPGKSDREEVMIHELVHAVTLQQSDRGIPMWFAEGIASYGERAQPDPMSVGLLKRGLLLQKVRPLSKLSEGFTRPDNRGDRILSYLLSRIAIGYIVETFGFSTIIRLIEGFRDRKEENTLLGTVLGVDSDQLDQDVLNAWSQFAKTRLDAPVFLAEDLKCLEERLEEERKTLGSASAEDSEKVATGLLDLASGCLSLSKPHKALQALRQALKTLSPDSRQRVRAETLMGELLLSRGSDALAQESFERALRIDPTDARARMGMVSIQEKKGDTKSAIQILTDPVEDSPSCLIPRLRLLRHLESARKGKSNFMNPGLEIEQLEFLSVTSRHDATFDKRLLQILDVATAAERILTVDYRLLVNTTFDPSLHLIAARALAFLKRFEEATERFELYLSLSMNTFSTGSASGRKTELASAALNSKESWKRRAAIRALSRCENEDATKQVFQGLEDEDPSVRLEAGISLALKSIDLGLDAILENWPESGDPLEDRTLEALQCASARDMPFELEVWKNWWKVHRSGGLARASLEALQEAGLKLPTAAGVVEMKDAPGLIGLLLHPSWPIAHQAFQRLELLTGRSYGRGLFDGPHNHHLLESYLSEPLPDLRKSAVEQWTIWWEDR